MTAPHTETLTAALRRLADEHASGLLSVAAPGSAVVLELADGTPVGIGPNHDASDRVGREAGAELVAAAVVDDLIDRTVAAIVGGGGDWTWDVGGDTAMLPVPPGLATELSRRAVDAAQALAMLEPDQVLLPARDLETHGEVDRARGLFDGDRTLAEVAEELHRTLPATATVAAALVGSGVLATGEEDPGPVSWTDAVAAAPTDADENDDEDEPELWVMEAPEDEEDEEAPEVAEDDQAVTRSGSLDTPAPAPVEQPAVGTGPAAVEAGATGTDEDDWSDTTWLDDLDGADQRAHAARGEVTTATPGAADTPGAAETPGAADTPAAGDGAGTGTERDDPEDTRAALSAMISEFSDPGRSAPAPAREPTDAEPRDNDTADTDGPDGDTTGDRDPGQRVSSEARRKEPKAAPGEVAEFLRELSRLALDED